MPEQPPEEKKPKPVVISFASGERIVEVSEPKKTLKEKIADQGITEAKKSQEDEPHVLAVGEEFEKRKVVLMHHILDILDPDKEIDGAPRPEMTKTEVESSINMFLKELRKKYPKLEKKRTNEEFVDTMRNVFEEYELPLIIDPTPIIEETDIENNTAQTA